MFIIIVKSGYPVLIILFIGIVSVLASNQSAFALTSCHGISGVYNPQFAVSGQNQYVAWTYAYGCWGSKVILASSKDQGVSFKPQITISNSSMFAGDPVIAASGNNAYIAWDQSGPNPELLFRESTDNGVSFKNPVIIGSRVDPNDHKTIIVAENGIEIVWPGETNNSTEAVFLSKSTDGGISFGEPYLLSNNTEQSFPINMLKSGNTVYIILYVHGRCDHGSFGCFTHSELGIFDINDPEHTYRMVDLGSVEANQTTITDKTGISDFQSLLQQNDNVIISPIKQVKLGFLLNDVRCKGGLFLVVKQDDGSPACVKPQTAQKLVEHGWGMILRE